MEEQHSLTNIHTLESTHGDTPNLKHIRDTRITHAHPHPYQIYTHSLLDTSHILTHPYLCTCAHIHVYTHTYMCVHIYTATHSYTYAGISTRVCTTRPEQQVLTYAVSPGQPRRKRAWPLARTEGRSRALRIGAVYTESNLVLRDSRLKNTGEGRVGGTCNTGTADGVGR